MMELSFLTCINALFEGVSNDAETDIWAVSLDGKENLIVLYEDGPSADPLTRLYRYDNDSLVDAGSFAADIRDCVITEAGIIHGVVQIDVLQTTACSEAGVRGWFQVVGYQVMELDKTSAEVFEGLNFAG